MMGSKKHKKHSKGRDDDGAMNVDQAPPIKLVLKMGGGGASPSPGPSPMVAYSSTVPAPSTLLPNPHSNPGISLRLVADGAECAVKKIENPLINGNAASDSHSETSHHKHKKSEKKKKKKKKHHHHHCHHHHKHHHSSQHSEKRKERGGDDDDDDDEEDDRPPKKSRHAVTESVDNQPPLPEVPLRSPIGVLSPKATTEMSPLQKLLNVLLELLRKRDVYDFFAWPVNDAIAPGYSSIILRPMDFSTIRRKLDNRQYRNLDSFRFDVRLICDNATTYNRPETIYYKEAKKLWRNAQKILSKEHILQLDPEMKSIGALTVEDLGFDLRSKSPIEELTPRVTRNRGKNDDERTDVVPPMRISLAASVVEHAIGTVEPVVANRETDQSSRAAPESSFVEETKESPIIERMHPETPVRRIDTARPARPAVPEEQLSNGETNQVPTRAASPGLARKSRPEEDATDLNPPSDDANAAEILEHAQRMARGAADRLALLKPATNYAFLRQQEDGSTTLNILNPDVTLTDKYPGARPPEVPVPSRKVDLEMLIGKLPYGVSHLVDFKDEARSIAKPLNYLPLESAPPFSTYAPHYDSSFSNLTKAESDLVYSTYGDEIGVQYAESIMHFAKDCDYVITMVDNLLDTLTGGEHRKTLETIKTGDLLREPKDDERPAVDKCNGERGPAPTVSTAVSVPPQVSSSASPAVSVQSKTPNASMASQNGFIGANNGSKSISITNGEVNGNQIDTTEDSNQSSTTTSLPKSNENEQKLQSKLAETTEMIERLTKLQKDRLSHPPPTHLGSVQGPSPAELELADKLAATLSELASHAKPGSIVSVDAIRRAMGITLPEKKV